LPINNLNPRSHRISIPKQCNSAPPAMWRSTLYSCCP
jgi:hypothetical protein